MERARYNTEPYSNQSPPHNNNVKPSNFWGSHHSGDKIFDYLRMHLAYNSWQYGQTWLSWKYPNGSRINFREFNSSEIFDLADDNLNMIDRIVKESIGYIEEMRDALTTQGYANTGNTT